jgi:hypothetical protein
MNRRSVRDLVMALYGAGDPAARIDALASVVIDLLVEVEALRGAALGAQGGDRGEPVHGGYDIPCHDETLAEGKGAYSAAYVDAAYVLHNAAGPTGGVEKLLARYYPAGGSGPREALMLKRLGFSAAEVARFVAAAEHAGQFS